MNKDQEFSFEHILVEMSRKYPSGVVKKTLD